MPATTPLHPIAYDIDNRILVNVSHFFAQSPYTAVDIEWESWVCIGAPILQDMPLLRIRWQDGSRSPVYRVPAVCNGVVLGVNGAVRMGRLARLPPQMLLVVHPVPTRG